MTTQNDYGNRGDTIGHTFRIAGTEFTITGDGGDRWIVNHLQTPIWMELVKKFSAVPWHVETRKTLLTKAKQTVVQYKRYLVTSMKLHS
jgi:hypothetical protein